MSLAAKTVLVTGANGGIGLPTCELLVADGVDHVIMACRTTGKADAARTEVLSAAGATPDRVSAVGGFDMIDPDAIRTAVDRLPANRTIDAVFLQAGGWVVGDDYASHTWEGRRYERTAFQNAFGGHAVIAALEARGLLAPGCRIVVMGGEGARGVPGMITPADFPNASAIERYLRGDYAGQPAYNPVNALGTSKLVNALWAQKLSTLAAGRYEVVWFSPGFTGGTAGTGGLPAYKEFLFQRIAFPILVALGQAQWPRAAARKCADAVEGKVGENGDLIGAPAGKAVGALTDQKPMSPALTDPALQDAVWAIAVEVAGPIGATHPHLERVG